MWLLLSSDRTWLGERASTTSLIMKRPAAANPKAAKHRKSGELLAACDRRPKAAANPKAAENRKSGGTAPGRPKAAANPKATRPKAAATAALPQAASLPQAPAGAHLAKAGGFSQAGGAANLAQAVCPPKAGAARPKVESDPGTGDMLKRIGSAIFRECKCGSVRYCVHAFDASDSLEQQLMNANARERAALTRFDVFKANIRTLLESS
jgi:hypothetical protein